MILINLLPQSYRQKKKTPLRFMAVTAASVAVNASLLAYLAWTEAIRPYPDGSYHVSRAPSAASLLPALVQIAETYKVFDLREATVSGVGQHSVRLVRGKGEVRLNLAAQPFLFARKGGRPVPARELEIWPGDRLRYRTGQGGAALQGGRPPRRSRDLARGLGQRCGTRRGRGAHRDGRGGARSVGDRVRGGSTHR